VDVWSQNEFGIFCASALFKCAYPTYILLSMTRIEQAHTFQPSFHMIESIERESESERRVIALFTRKTFPINLTEQQATQRRASSVASPKIEHKNYPQDNEREMLAYTNSFP
jgi:hypothetical protein